MKVFVKKSTLIFLLMASPLLTQASLKCIEVLARSTEKIVDSPTFTALRALAVSGKPFGLTKINETFDRKSRALIKTITYSNVTLDGRGAVTLVKVTLKYKNSESNGMKPPKWELSDEAIIQAGASGSQNLTGQKISLKRSTKIVSSQDREILTREYFGEFEAAENWTARLSISTITDKAQPNQSPVVIYLGSTLF